MKKWILLFILLCLTGCTQKPTSIKVAVIDSGFTNDVPWSIQDGWNYLEDSSITLDDTGHGSAVGEMIYTVSPSAIQIPLKISDKENMTMPAMIATAIYDAIDKYECQIINISGGLSNHPSIEQAVQYAEEKKVIVIAAVGNHGETFKKNKVYYPAGYDTVVGIGSVDKDGKVASYSQQNESVFVTCQSGKNKGTSYSAGVITGLAADYLSHHRKATPEDFRAWLCDQAKDEGDIGYDTAYGWGIIEINLPS